jgi:hypothetical protein
MEIGDTFTYNKNMLFITKDYLSQYNIEHIYTFCFFVCINYNNNKKITISLFDMSELELMTKHSKILLLEKKPSFN